MQCVIWTNPGGGLCNMVTKDNTCIKYLESVTKDNTCIKYLESVL